MMSKMPLVYAPNFRQSRYVDNCHYTGDHNPLISVFENAGFDFHLYQPDWRNPRPSEWASDMAEFATRLAHAAGGGVVLAGFSAGGLTAILATDLLRQAGNVEVDGLVGCSFTPWFGLDRVRQAHTFPQSEIHGISEALKTALSDMVLPKIGCPAQLYAGEQEMVTIHEIRDEALAQWPQAEAITPTCGHNVFHDSYLRALGHNVGRLALS